MEMKRLQVEKKPVFIFCKEAKTTPSWSLKPMPELLPFCNKLMQTSSPLWQLNMYVKQLRTLQSISHLDGVHDLSDFTNMKTPPKPPADPLESMKAPLKPPPIDPKEAIKGHQAGDGIRSMEVLIVFVHYFDILTFRPPVCSEHWISSCMWSQTSTSWPLELLPSAVALATLLTWSTDTESKDFTQQLMTMTKCTSPKRDPSGTSLK